eukprot:gene12904-7416_t
MPISVLPKKKKETKNKRRNYKTNEGDKDSVVRKEMKKKVLKNLNRIDRLTIHIRTLELKHLGIRDPGLLCNTMK